MLSGSVRIDGRRIEGRFSFAAWALRLRLESVSGTPREFLFTAEPGKETLVHRGAHEVRGRSAELIEAVLGLPLNSEDMRRVRQRRFARRSRRTCQLPTSQDSPVAARIDTIARRYSREIASRATAGSRRCRPGRLHGFKGACSDSGLTVFTFGAQFRGPIPVPMRNRSANPE
jgi:hypothetical protein